MIPRTCSFSHTKNKNVMERWHYTETWDDFPYFSICYCCFAYFNCTMTVLVWPYWGQEISPTWHGDGTDDGSLTCAPEWGKGGLLFLPHLLFDYKTVSSWGSILLLTCLETSQVSSSNKSLLIYHFPLAEFFLCQNIKNQSSPQFRCHVRKTHWPLLVGKVAGGNEQGEQAAYKSQEK